MMMTTTTTMMMVMMMMMIFTCLHVCVSTLPPHTPLQSLEEQDPAKNQSQVKGGVDQGYDSDAGADAATGGSGGGGGDAQDDGFLDDLELDGAAEEGKYDQPAGEALGQAARTQGHSQEQGDAGHQSPRSEEIEQAKVEAKAANEEERGDGDGDEELRLEPGECPSD
jgi:hypothetical protein